MSDTCGYRRLVKRARRAGASGLILGGLTLERDRVWHQVWNLEVDAQWAKNALDQLVASPEAP